MVGHSTIKRIYPGVCILSTFADLSAQTKIKYNIIKKPT